MTVTLCHRYTPPEDLADAVHAADLVVSAAGVPGIITREMVKPGAVLVDVGLTRVCHLGKNLVVGDVHREARQVRDALSKVLSYLEQPSGGLIGDSSARRGWTLHCCLPHGQHTQVPLIQGAHQI